MAGEVKPGMFRGWGRALDALVLVGFVLTAAGCAVAGRWPPLFVSAFCFGWTLRSILGGKDGRD
jgi:hypothetical protein